MSNQHSTPSGDLVVFAYDGSELAIEEAGRQLAPGRDALVVTRPEGRVSEL